MSLTRCDECEEFIDTDSDPDSCIGDRFICEACREDIAIDDHIHQTINELRIQNAELIRALKETQEIINRLVEGWAIENIELKRVQLICKDVLTKNQQTKD